MGIDGLVMVAIDIDTVPIASRLLLMYFHDINTIGNWSTVTIDNVLSRYHGNWFMDIDASCW